MKNSNYSLHRGIVRVFGKRATKQNGEACQEWWAFFYFYLQKYPRKNKTASGKRNLLPW